MQASSSVGQADKQLTVTIERAERSAQSLPILIVALGLLLLLLDLLTP
jgi:hypothetical protein